MRVARLLVLAVFVLALSASGASAVQLSSTSVSSPDRSFRECHERLLSSGARGVDQERVTMPAHGSVLATLEAARGDWDVAIFDARSGRSISGSAGAGSEELAQGFADGDRDLVVQACRLSGRSESAQVTVTALPLPTDAAPGKVQLVRVDTPTQASKDLLTDLGLDLTEHGGEGFVEAVLHGTEDADLLRRAGFGFDVRIPDLTERNRQNAQTDAAFARSTRASDLPSGAEQYRRLPDYEFELKELARTRPDLVKLIELPLKSREGRTVYGIEVTRNPNAGDGKPVFFQMGLHHAREWPSGEHTLEFAYDLVRGYGNDDRTTQLVNSTRTVFVPVVNVDGFNLSREAAYDMRNVVDPTAASGNPYAVISLTDPFFAYKRRNCGIFNQNPPRGACGTLPLRHQGVDPNRNYGALWGGPGASAFPHEDTYRGPAPNSEPEVQNVREVVSKRQVTTLITNHTFSNLVLRPPGVREQGPPPDEAIFNDLGARMAEQNGYTNQPGYALYDTTGTTEDWSYGATGGLGYTFEIGPTEFHPPYEEMIDEYLGKEGSPYEGKGNRAAYFLALENTADATKHSVLEGQARPGSVLRLHKEFLTETSPVRRFQGWLWDDPSEPGDKVLFEDKLDTTMTVPESGRFEWHINPSTRPGVATRTLPQTSETPSRSEEFENTEPSAIGDHKDFPFTITPEDNAKLLRVTVDWATPDDYDLEVYRKEGEELEDVGGSGNAPGQTEEFFLDDPAPGEYVARVVNFAAINPSYTVGVELYPPGEAIVEQGTTESWTLTCETSGGQVLASEKVTIARGERLSIAACRPDADDAAVQGFAAGNCANLQAGTASADTLRGTRFGDRLQGKRGRDRLLGHRGNDCLSGGKGRDSVAGGSGRDKLRGGRGRDRMSGGRGRDVLRGGPGRNFYRAGKGRDRVYARNDKRETVRCGPGRRDWVKADREDKLRGCERARQR